MTGSTLELLIFFGFRMNATTIMMENKSGLGFTETKQPYSNGETIAQLAVQHFETINGSPLSLLFLSDHSHYTTGFSKHTSCPFMTIDYLRSFPKMKFIINSRHAGVPSDF